MLTRIAQLATRFPLRVLFGALIVTAGCAVAGATVLGQLQTGGFTSDNAESSRAARILADQFDGAQPNLVMVVTSDSGVDSPAARTTGEEVTSTLSARRDIVGVRSIWNSPPAVASGLRSADGKKALVLAYVTGTDNQAQRISGQLAKQFAHTPAGVTVRASGIAAMYHDANDRIIRDLLIAEACAIPITGIVLILVFGSVVAAALPLTIGIIAIVGTTAILRIFTTITDVSTYALNMTTALGLALAIDYSLFIVSRYREELAAGRDHAAAATRAVQTAGRTVLFSALTVALTTSVMAVFDIYFLKSFAYAGTAVVIMAAGAAIIVLPAILVLLGDRINAWDLRAALRRVARRPASMPRPDTETLWYRMVTWVMRRALPVSIVIIALLSAVGSPFLGVVFGYPDERVLPPQSAIREITGVLRTDFPASNTGIATTIVLPGHPGDIPGVTTYATALSHVPGVRTVVAQSGIYTAGAKVLPAPPGLSNATGQFLTVYSTLNPYSAAGKDQLTALRKVPAPGPRLFAGAPAMNADSLQSMGSRLPLAITMIVLTTFVVLFLFTGSVVLPLKALVINTLSLTAMFGSMVWVFQDGHFSGLLGFTGTGFLVATMPILMFCLAFGLSMDYEVFLLSRIREEWLASDRTAADNEHAVALGVARTGRIVTAAALLMAIVLGAMISSQVSFMKMFGLGLTITVLADATIIRMLLVPALMRLMGRLNWWAPGFLACWHERFGFTENSAEPATPAKGQPGQTEVVVTEVVG